MTQQVAPMYNERQQAREDHAPTSPSNKRNSNTAEGEVHQRAQLVLQMAMSLETSNHRRSRQLKQIESGKMHHVQQVIDDIMQEEPANLMTILQETDPERLPSPEELKERYQTKCSKNGDRDRGRRGISDSDVTDEESDNDSEDDDDEEEGQYEEFTVSRRTRSNGSSDKNKRQRNDEEFHMKQDQIIALSQAPAPLPSNIHPDTLHAHTAPLQEQLKRSYEAIVRLRENADLRYEALEEKYNALKREKQSDGTAQRALAQKAGMPAVDLNTIGNEPMKEQLTQAYEALIRLRENSELRLNVLESKYLDLKRSHTEVDGRNERLEEELEKMRMQLKRARQHNAQLYQNSQKNTNTNNNTGISNTMGKKDRLRIRTLLLEFQDLVEKAEVCDNCQPKLPNGKKLKKKLKKQLAKMEEEFINNGEEVTDDESDSDNDDESVDDADSEALSSLSSAKRHDGAIAILGANWETISKIDVTKEELKPGGRFANASESKSEQRLRGKPSQFVACQSGVYCRIDHDMNQYGSLEDRYQKAKVPSPPPPTPAQPQPFQPQSVESVKSAPQPAIRNAPVKPAIKSPMKPALKPALKSAMKNPLPSLQESETEDDLAAEESDQTLPTTCSTKESESQLSSLTLTLGEDSIQLLSGDNLPSEDSQEDVRPPSPESEQPRRPPPPALANRKSSRALNGRPGLQKKAVSFANRISVTNAQEESKKEAAFVEDEKETEKAPPPRHLFAPSAPGENSVIFNEEKADAFEEAETDRFRFNDGSESKDESEHDNSKSSLDHSPDMDASATSIGSKTRRIPPAKLDPAERRAKQKAALREAKRAARIVRKQNRTRRHNKGDMDDGSSLVSGISGNSSIATDTSGVSQNSNRGFLHNPFKRKNKAFETAAARTAGIPTTVQQGSASPVISPAAPQTIQRVNEFSVEV